MIYLVFMHQNWNVSSVILLRKCVPIWAKCAKKQMHHHQWWFIIRVYNYVISEDGQPMYHHHHHRHHHHRCHHHHHQGVQLRNQRGWSTDVPWKSYFGPILQQDHPLMGLVSFLPSSPPPSSSPSTPSSTTRLSPLSPSWPTPWPSQPSSSTRPSPHGSGKLLDIIITTHHHR